MLLGVHCSIAGGVNNAFNEVVEHELDTFQIFTKNQRQWKEKIFETDEGALFQVQKKSKGIKVAFSHATYLINIASCNEILWRQSIQGLVSEIKRCDALALDYTVLHPGACKGSSEEEGIKRAAEAVKVTLEDTPFSQVKILLEITAGQGSSLGYTIQHLKEIIERVQSDRVAICFDTCHAFAAGYDIRTQTGMEDTIELIDQILGIEKLRVFHLNDSKGDLNSRIDRHENIGKGKIGLEPFKVIMQNFKHIPKVIETDKDFDKENLALLRSL